MNNNMITEDYVSFEVAKLLKEKGFDEPVTELNKLLFKEGEKPVLKITHQKAMKWLREIHKILILVEYDCPIFSSDIYKMDNIDEYGSAKHIPPTFANCKNYEEACETAIKYCLENLI